MYMSAGIDFNLIQVSLLNIAYEDFYVISIEIKF